MHACILPKGPAYEPVYEPVAFVAMQMAVHSQVISLHITVTSA